MLWLTLGKRWALQPQQFWSYGPQKLKVRLFFCIFFHFAWDCLNLEDILATQEVANLKINISTTSGKKWAIGPQQFGSYGPQILKKVIFRLFFYFAWDCSNLGDCLATKEVGNLKRNVMATSGLNVSSVTPLFLELWPIEIKNQVILCFFFHFAWDCSNLGDILATQEVANLKINIFTTSGQKIGSVAPVVWEPV